MPHPMKTTRPARLCRTLLTVGLLTALTPALAKDLQHLVVAGGCFWCVESDFESVPGVVEAVSGYTGGHTSAPSYDQVSAGGTGHYEAVRITFDADAVSRDRLLHLYFRSIDPTDAGGQFCDRGDSYRTAVFVASPAERRLAEAARDEARRTLGQPIATAIAELGPFHPAEAYHQDYYKQDDIILTRRGFKSKADAYTFYRQACGRDARVEALWGPEAPFIHHHK